MRIRIRGWQTSRLLIVEDGRVFFEVAEENHCATCNSRLQMVRQRVAQDGLDAVFQKRLTQWGETVFVGLLLPTDGEKISQYVAKTLGFELA